MSDTVLVEDDQPVDPDDELLVAYLDDELDDTTRKSVESRLVAEANLRHRLQTLQTGWEWLDELPEETSNEKLVESTIELAVADILPQNDDEISWLHQHWKAVTFVSVLIFGFFAGAIGTSLARQIALQRELAELEIAENLEAYKLGPDVTFYRELMYEDRWQSMIRTMEKVGGRDMAPPNVVDQIPLEERKQSLPTLPTQTRNRLAGRWETYKGYSEEAKSDLRKTADKVKQQDDADQILETMKAASLWMEDLNEETRDNLRNEDPAIRKQAIHDAIDITMAKMARKSGKLISDETSDRIFLWLQLVIRRRASEHPDFTRRMQQTKAYLNQKGLPEELAEHWLMRMLTDTKDYRSRGGRLGGPFRLGPSGGAPGFPGGPPGFVRPPDSGENRRKDGSRSDPERRPVPWRTSQISDDEFDDLKQMLGDDALADLEALTSFSTELAGDVAVNETLRSWASESVDRHAPVLDSGEKTSLDRYREHEQRDILDLMPPEVIVHEVYSRNKRGESSRRGPR